MLQYNKTCVLPKHWSVWVLKKPALIATMQPPERAVSCTVARDWLEQPPYCAFPGSRMDTVSAGLLTRKTWPRTSRWSHEYCPTGSENQRSPYGGEDVYSTKCVEDDDDDDDEFILSLTLLLLLLFRLESDTVFTIPVLSIHGIFSSSLTSWVGGGGGEKWGEYCSYVLFP